MPYAAETDVPVERTKANIEQMLKVRGATHFGTGWDAEADRIQFSMGSVSIRFLLPRVKAEDADIAFRPNGTPRPQKDVESRMAQRNRSRWRALYLVIKAKLEAVDAGIAVFEEEFLAFVVMRDGKTVGDFIVPQIKGANGAAFQIEAKAGKDGRG